MKKNWYELTDRQIIKELGLNIKEIRLNKNITQEQLAIKTALSRVTISKIENGTPVSFLHLIKVLRVLEKLELFNEIIFEKKISPKVLFEIEQKKRKRASN